MTFRPSGPARPPAARHAIRLPRWPRTFLPVLLGLVALIIVVVIASGVWTDFLWFRSVHYTTVFGVTYGTRWALFFAAGTVMVVLTGASAVLAYRLRPVYRPVSAHRSALESYRMAVDPHRLQLLAVVLAVTGILTGLAASGSWRTWLLFSNQVPFGVSDPQFHLDLSFFVFTYPFIRLVLGYLFVAVLLALLVAVVVHALYGGLRWHGRRPRASAGAQAHLFVLVGIFVLLKAVAYWFDRYGIDFSQRGVMTTGASYTDVNAVLPAKTVLAVIALLCALLFFAGAVRHSATLPGVGLGLLVLSAILIGGVYPAVIQQFVVGPNALAKESPYLTREIHATRQAYGISRVRVQNYPGVPAGTPAQQAAGVARLHGMRLLDPAVVSPSFQQLQQIKGYYRFPAQLAVDRYVLAGGGRLPQDLVVAVRGLSGPPSGQGNWVNSHLVYTHGFGFVAARANVLAASPPGSPSFAESDIPPVGVLGRFQPRVYFGEQENTYAIVGGPPHTPPVELDYPQASAGGQRNTTYRGDGGVPIGSLPARLAYAVKFTDINMLLSGAINGDSRVLYDRQPLARVAKVAPFLTLDGSTYPVVAHGRILWVVDGYTTTDLYPYSERLSMQQATTSSLAPGGSVAGAQPRQINYLRNPVKAVVDAYSGAVTLYQWGPPDPVLATWMKAFPGLIQPRRAIPGYLLPHLRYPVGQFEVQRQILGRYHVQQAQSFYGGQNFWSVPHDPTVGQGGAAQPPYYLTMTMPGYRQPTFSLTGSMVQRGRQNLAAYLAVDSNPQAGYGSLRILQLPQDAAILGPQQVQNIFESNGTASKDLSLYRQGGSTVIFGDLIALPAARGLLYEEPVYIQAAGGNAGGTYPTAPRVLAYFDGRVGYAATLREALAQIVPGLASISQPIGGTGPGGAAAVRVYLQQAQRYYAQAQAALAAHPPDWAGYGQAIARMEQALSNAQKAAAAVPAAPGAAPPAPPSAAPSPGPGAH
ncbi:MAG: UPF0182 family protein [Gemmatimonadota bacterium]